MLSDTSAGVAGHEMFHHEFQSGQNYQSSEFFDTTLLFRLAVLQCLPGECQQL